MGLPEQIFSRESIIAIEEPKISTGILLERVNQVTIFYMGILWAHGKHGRFEHEPENHHPFFPKEIILEIGLF